MKNGYSNVVVIEEQTNMSFQFTILMSSYQESCYHLFQYYTSALSVIHTYILAGTWLTAASNGFYRF
jgi:hypothetical protein